MPLGWNPSRLRPVLYRALAPAQNAGERGLATKALYDLLCRVVIVHDQETNDKFVNGQVSRGDMAWYYNRRISRTLAGRSDFMYTPRIGACTGRRSAL